MAERTAPPRFEHFPHAADMGVRGYGESLAAAFENAALAVTAVVCLPARVAGEEVVAIRCEGSDPELLLVDWLNAVIYEMAVRKLLFGRYEVEIRDGILNARAYGEPVDRKRHEPAVEVKGATYTALSVERRPDGVWVAQCVVDV
jgi:tRNA nucleotidyltransferase (CCA-adding enzyme)